MKFNPNKHKGVNKTVMASGPFSGAPPDGGRQETTSFLSTLLSGADYTDLEDRWGGGYA